MTDTEQRFALSMREADSDEPGLIRERDGTVWLVNPDGTRTQLGAENGGSQPGAVRWLGPCKVNAFAGQYISSAGVPTGGTFKLNVGAEQTAAIPFDAPAADVVTALEALPSLGADTVAIDPRSDQTLSDGYALVFKDLIVSALVTGDYAGLTGPDAPYAPFIAGSEDFLVEMFTPTVGDIIEDFLHVIPSDWDGAPKLSYIDSTAAASPNPDALSPGWVVPSGDQGPDLEGLEIADDSASDYTNFFGLAGDPAVSRQSTTQLALIGEWVKVPTHLYGNLPAVVRNAVPIYSRLFDVSDAPTGGEVWIFVKVSTPAPLMD